MNPEYFLNINKEISNIGDYELLPMVSVPKNNNIYRLSNVLENENSYYLKIFDNGQIKLKDSLNKAITEVIAYESIRSNLEDFTPNISRFLGSDEFGNTALLLSEIKGVSFESLIKDTSDKKSLLEVAFNTGKYLSEIHKITASNFGELTLEGYKSNDWSEYFCKKMNEYVEIALSNLIINKDQTLWFKKKLSSPIFYEKNILPVLCHGDFTPQNILVNPDNHVVTGIIDFELAKYWVPGWDLAKAHDWYMSQNYYPDLENSFLEGYSSSDQIKLNKLKEQINFYEPFVHLLFWTSRWNCSSLKEEIKEDIKKIIN